MVAPVLVAAAAAAAGLKGEEHGAIFYDLERQLRKPM